MLFDMDFPEAAVSRRSRELGPIDRLLAKTQKSDDRAKPLNRNLLPALGSMQWCPAEDGPYPDPCGSEVQKMDAHCQTVSWASAMADAVLQERKRASQLQAELQALRELLKQHLEVAISSSKSAERARVDALESDNAEIRTQRDQMISTFEAERKRWEEERSRSQCDLEQAIEELDVCRQRCSELAAEAAERDGLLLASQEERVNLTARIDALQSHLDRQDRWQTHGSVSSQDMNIETSPRQLCSFRSRISPRRRGAYASQ